MKKYLMLFGLLFLANFCFAQTFKQDMKKAGKEIGRGTKKAAKTIGKESKKGAKAVGRGTKKAARQVKRDLKKKDD